ncbi:MAG: transcription termination factor NusA [Candidatus Margulisiibacteriota bacterium]
MIVIEELPLVLAQIEKERGIAKEVIIEALKSAFLSACKKVYHEDIWPELSVELDENSGNMKVLQGSTDVTPENFGRLAAQTAKQVILQRIREAEKNSIYDEFDAKKGTVIIGTVQRIEGRNYLINLGRIEATLHYSEQIHKERYSLKDKIRVYIVEAKKTSRGPMLVVSRKHPGLLKCLMTMEIPEIQSGTIEIKSVAREPGVRSKVAVISNDSDVGAVGTCVGHMGQRIQSVVRELSDERIDIIEWNENPKVLITNALKPAKVTSININETEHSAVVAVPEDQLALAIGKNGQNIRLATRLTGWRIDVINEKDFVAQKEEKKLTLKEKIALAKAKKAEEDKLSSVDDKVAEPVVEKVAEAILSTDKIKVSQLAKELSTTSKYLLSVVSSLGIDAKAHNSNLSAEDAERVRAEIAAKGENEANDEK